MVDLTPKGKNNPDGKFDWGDAVADALILAGVSFFTSLGALGVSGLLTNPLQGLLSAGISAGANFCIILATKRGLVKREA